MQRPTLVLAHNKTLAAQLANEFRELMPNNAVEYFVSYYDYYQPEAYVPQTDTFIEKDSSINAEVERLRHSTTNSLLSRRDVIVVSTVSCIYGLGAPRSTCGRWWRCRWASRYDRDALIRKFIAMQYNRNDVDFSRGNFRVRGDTIEIIPVYEEYAIRIELFGDEIEALYMLHPLTGDVVQKLDSVPIFPASHYVAGTDTVQRAIGTIEDELEVRLASSSARASCSRPSACACARRSTSRCCSSSASAPASRTTPATSTAVRRARRRTACSTSSPTTSWS